MVFGQINTYSPSHSMLIKTMQMTFIAENIAIFLNIFLLFTFWYQIRAEKQRIFEANNYYQPSTSPPPTPTCSSHTKSIPDKPKNQTSTTASPNNNSSGFFRNDSYKRSQANQNKRELQWQTVYVTWSLLIVGFIFSLCQGLIENWLTVDCAAFWLQCLTFFFYALHRSMLLFSCLHRLIFVFKDSAYAYPDCFYYLLMILIIFHFIGSYIIYVIDHGVTPVDIDMYTGFSGEILCSWSFGVLFSGVARPIEIMLQLVLVIPFLCMSSHAHILLLFETTSKNLCKQLNTLQINYGVCIE